MFTIKVYQRPKKKAFWKIAGEKGRGLLRSSSLGYGLVGAFALADLVLLLLAFPLSREKAAHQARVKALQTTLLQVGQQEERLRFQIAFLSQRQGEGILWAEKLEALPQLLPSSLWLEEVEVEKEPSGPKSVSGTQTGGPSSGKGLQLVIRGLSAASQGSNPIDLIGDFARALNEDPSFSKEFEAIRLESIETSREKGEATAFLLRGQSRLRKP